MFFKKILIILLSFLMCCTAFAGCKTEEPNPTPPNPPEEESFIPTTPDVDYGERIPEPKNHLMEDFNFGSGGFTESSFYINNNLWGYNNNGVKGENVSYTADGIALLKAYGDYAENANYKRSGACLLSRDYLTPGLIEVSMKIMPRLGGCTAIWPFYSGTEADTNKYLYQEIDIEYPAGNETVGGVNIPATYEKVMNTNYADTWSENGGGPVRSTKTETLTPANDGAWHKYSILWETYPTPRIRYYVDGILTSDTLESPNGYKTVSTASAPLQIGVWFPNGWAGDRDFDEAYAQVDWVSYRAMTKQPYKEAVVPETIQGIYHSSLYPTKPVSLPETNYISNGTFENLTSADQEGKDKTPWNDDYSTNLLVNNGASGKALSLNAGKKVSQVITAVYGKSRSSDPTFGDASYFFEYDLTGSFKVSGSASSTVKVEFLNDRGEVIPSGTKTLTLTKAEDFKLSVKSVNGSKKMRVTLSTESGTGLFDNLKMVLLKTSK